MFDAKIRPLIDPPLNAAGQGLAKLGLSADHVTLIGFGFGLLSFGAIAFGWFWLGLVFLLLNRLADGLDGAVARAERWFLQKRLTIETVIVAARHGQLMVGKSYGGLSFGTLKGGSSRNGWIGARYRT